MYQHFNSSVTHRTRLGLAAW